MTYLGLLTHTVTVTNPTYTGTSDIYGNDEAGTITVSEQALIQPLPGKEELLNRDTRQARFRMFFTANSVVTGLSTVTWDTHIIQVDGEPEIFDFGTVPHIEANGFETLG